VDGVSGDWWRARKARSSDQYGAVFVRCTNDFLYGKLDA
jgi:hypothetical protein